MNDNRQIVISGNNIETLKNYPDNYFDSIVTDPPYGLGKEPNAEEMLKAWIDTGYLEVKGSGFMGKEWDAFVPQPIFWKEIFRVLKHGGHIVAFFGTRTYDWGCMAIRLAGFEIRDSISWVYATGFPKSHNISKAINKMGGIEYDEIPASGVGFMKPDSEDWNVTKNQLIQKGESTEEAKEWEGWGSALKPAHEDLVLARKPLEKGLSIAQNVLKWGTGGINIDGCRVGNEKRTTPIFLDDTKNDGTTFNLNSNIQHHREETTQGRFPANFIMTHHEDCKDWNCVDDCPIKILDKQSGITESKKNERGNVIDNNVYGKYKEQDDTLRGHNDKGGASRFFYVAKASQWERNYGLENFEEKNSASSEFRPNHLEKSLNGESGNPYGRWKPLKNIHPTVKPIKLMQYLVRMITPPNGIVLDPFAGSGTTGIACKIDGFEFVGLELSEEYTEIANSRIQSFNEELLLFDETIIYKNRGDEENDTDSQQLTLFE